MLPILSFVLQIVQQFCFFLFNKMRFTFCTEQQQLLTKSLQQHIYRAINALSPLYKTRVWTHPSRQNINCIRMPFTIEIPRNSSFIYRRSNAVSGMTLWRFPFQPNTHQLTWAQTFLRFRRPTPRGISSARFSLNSMPFVYGPQRNLGITRTVNFVDLIAGMVFTDYFLFPG